MTYFKTGGVPNPDYDSEDINYIQQKTEFTSDVFVYGNLYAALGGDVQTFSTGGVERMRITKEGDIIFKSNGVSISGITTIATLNVDGNTNLSGITTGTFVGDGSGLTGVIGVGQGIEVQDNSSVVGTAGTVNFDTNLDVVSFSGGAVTVRGSQNFTGVVTATSADINGDIDVNGNANIGVNNFTYRPASSNWATSSAINLVGDHAGGIAFNDNGNDGFVLYLDGGGANFHLKNGSVGGVTKQSIRAVKDSDVELYFNGNEKLSTTNDGVKVFGDITLDGTPTTSNQNRRIFFTGFDKESTGDFTDTAEIRHTTNIHGISGSVLEIISTNDANDGIALNASGGVGQISLVGNVRVYNGLRDKDGDLGSSGQVLSSTGSQTNWIDFAGGNVAQARKVSDSSTSTQFNPIGYVDKLTLTVSNVQSSSNILLFFRMTLQHSGSGTTLGRVTGPSLFGGDTQFSVASNPGSQTFSGVLFDASSSTTREFKIQYADNGGVSSAILNTELFATEIKVS